VYLKQGGSENEGNVYATNARTGQQGPVCDDGWNELSVRVNNKARKSKTIVN
jgi:hypothetical protein